MARDQRRLAAIVAADVAGYSRLMASDESGTLAALKGHRRELIDPKIAEYGGRIVKTTGDGLLLEFSSVVDAMRCAVDVQRGMAERNTGTSVDRRIDFRIGVNLGDVIIEGDDIFGDGVNVAARLEALAEPGGIRISGKVYEEVANKLDYSFEDQGARQLKNIAQPIQVYAVDPHSTGTTKAGKVVPSTVTVEAAPLYGRAEDFSVLRELIEHNLLVTVVGPGGIGKTRLAEAVARDLRDTFVEGVWLVELAPLADPTLVAVTVARAIGVVTGDPGIALELIVQALADRRLFLVLDNCEHLLDAVDQVVAAVRKGAPRVHLLATSQELLRHPDEHVYRLGALALPADVTLVRAREAGAVELFAARVQQLEPRFQVSEANVAAVVDICRRLDGIPLAIELAAARVPLLGVEGVRDRLDERFRLLTAGSRLALRRHQTLRAALEWSYSLLSEPEQRIFDGLGVFAGGFSLESAQKLATDAEIDEWAVLDHLGALVDKSLVIAEGGSARYRMLETTRAFALERLTERGATLPMLRRHAEVILSLFERFYRDIVAGGASPGEQLKRLGADLDNLRAAIHWANGPDGDLRTAIALVGASGAGRGFLTKAGLQWEGWQWCKALKPRIDASIPTADAARFWVACAEQGMTESLDTSAQDAERAIPLYRDAQDRLGEFLAWHQLSYVRLLAHRFDDARRALVEQERLLDPSWPPRLRSGYENMAGLYFDSAGQPQEAREHLVAFLNLTRQMRSDSEELLALGLLADLDVETGHPDRAVELLREPISRARASTPRYSDGLAVRNYATALMESGHLEEAESAFRDALPLVRRAYGSAAFVLHDAASLLARRGRIDDAARVFACAESVYAAVGRKPRPVALRNRERLLALLAVERSADTRSRLYDEGCRLTDGQACALAFPPSPSA